MINDVRASPLQDTPTSSFRYNQVTWLNDSIYKKRADAGATQKLSDNNIMT